MIYYPLLIYISYNIRKLKVYKNEVDWSFIKFVTSFLQCDKTCNFVHDEAFEVQHAMPILGVGV